MNMDELAQKLHDHAEELSWIVDQITEMQDGDEWPGLKREAEEACRKWRKFSQSKEAINAGSEDAGTETLLGKVHGLRDMLLSVTLSGEVLGIDLDIRGWWKMQLRENTFRELFSVYTHEPFGNTGMFQLEVVSKGVRIFCITDEPPETDAEIIASELQYDRQAYLQQVRQEALAGDLISRNRGI